MPNVEKALVRYRGEARRWRTIALCVGVGLAIPLLLGSKPAATDELRVKRLLLVDESGGVRAELSVREDGSPSLRFVGNDDFDSLVARGAPSGPTIELADGKGGAAWLNASATGASFVLSKNQGEIELAARASGFPKAEVRDKAGKVVWAAAAP